MGQCVVMFLLVRRSGHAFGLLVSHELRQPGSAAQLDRAIAKGAAIAVRPGVYMRARRWHSLSGTDRTLARIYAASLAHPGVVFAAHSAAALLRLPLPEDDLAEVHVVEAPAGAEGLVAHPESAGSGVVARYGLQVTSPVQTVLDMAVLLDQDAALALLRAAIRPAAGPHGLSDEVPLCTKAELLAAAETVAERTGDATPVELAKALVPEVSSLAA